MQAYLQATEIIDWTHHAVREYAAALAIPGDAVGTAKHYFEFVRDEIKHSCDFQLDPVTYRASDVLRHGTGYCYAKSHLLAALLRASGQPAGLCYQRLSLDETGSKFCLHGYNAIYLPQQGWYRVDARGNKPGVDAQFDPPREKLAFKIQSTGECDFESILTDSLECVVRCLRNAIGWQSVSAALPDVEPVDFRANGLRVRAPTELPGRAADQV